ncbi:MAG: hypothetical protein ACI9UR_002712 [Bacteroidia bacterium]|jgi:hypothetical protein
MLTSILKTRTLAGFALAYVICGLMLGFGLITQNPEAAGTEMLFSHRGFYWLEPFPKVIPWVCTALLSLSAMLSRLRPSETKLAYGSANFTMLLIVCIALTQIETVFAKPDVLAAAAVSLAMFLLLGSTYKNENVLSELFHCGLLLGLSSLFIGQTILLLIPLLFSLLILRTGNWKEWAVLLLGIAMCTVFVMMFTVWSAEPLLEFKRVVQSAWGGYFSQQNLNAGHVVLSFALVAAVAAIFRSLTLGTVTERNLILVNLSWIVTVGLMVILFGLGWQEGLILVSFPLSASITQTIEKIKRWWLADLLLLLILSAPFVKSLWHF